MKKILLIGKYGQLGQEIIRDAGDFGFKVFAFDREQIDVKNESLIEQEIRTIKPDILINTSAYHVLSQCEKNSTEAMLVNFVAVRNMAKLCKKYNILFVTYSTDYVFDGKKKSLYDENDKPSPLQMYGMSKLAGEYAVLSVYPKGSFIIRTCGLYGGKNGSPVKGNFVLNIINEAKNKKILNVGSGQVVSPTYAGDLSKATLKLLNETNNFGVYHLINEGSCSWYDFAVEIMRLKSINIDINPVKVIGLNGIIKRPQYSALKNVKAKMLGVELPSWKEGLKSYIKQII